jgi:hypothetical protein
MLVSAQDWNALMDKVDTIAASVARIDQTTKASRRMEDTMAKTLDDVIADIEELGTKEEGLIALVNNLEQQVKDALAGVTLPPEVQTKIDTAFEAVEARKQAIQDAIDAGTPPSPPPDTTPPDQPQVNPLK